MLLNFKIQDTCPYLYHFLYLGGKNILSLYIKGKNKLFFLCFLLL